MTQKQIFIAIITSILALVCVFLFSPYSFEQIALVLYIILLACYAVWTLWMLSGAFATK